MLGVIVHLGVKIEFLATCCVFGFAIVGVHTAWWCGGWGFVSYGSYNCFVGFHCPWFKLWNALFGVPNLDAKFSISWRVLLWTYVYSRLVLVRFLASTVARSIGLVEAWQGAGAGVTVRQP